MYKQRSARIENILDNCITAIHEQRETVAECLARYPTHRQELESLLRLTVRLRAARTLQASPEFRHLSAIRVHNLVTARQRSAEQAVAGPSRGDRVQRGWQAVLGASEKLTGTIVVSLVLIALLLMGGGVVYASTDDLPGDALYPVKRAAESVRLTISLNDADIAKLRLSLAIRRLNEVVVLLEKGRPQDIDQALANYDVQMELITTFLDRDSTLSPDEQSTLADQLIEVQAHHEAQFTVLLSQSPLDARPAIELALTTSRTARDRALQVLGQPGEPKEPQGPPECTQTAPPQTSPKPPTRTPSRTPVPIPSSTLSPQRPSVTATPRPTQSPIGTLTPTPSLSPIPLNLTPPSRTPPPPTPEQTPTPRLTPPLTVEWTPTPRSTPPTPEWTSTPWPTLEWTPTPRSTPPLTVEWTPTPRSTLPTPEQTPTSWPTPLSTPRSTPEWTPSPVPTVTSSSEQTPSPEPTSPPPDWTPSPWPTPRL